MKWTREIKEVGFKDWFWFVIVLGRNEFSSQLDHIQYEDKPRIKLIADRNRAHRIDKALSDIVHDTTGLNANKKEI